MAQNQPLDHRKKTTRRSLTIAETLMELDGASLSEISEELGLAKSTAYAHLETLRDGGFVVKEDGIYNVGMQFLNLGGYAANRKVGYKLAEEKVRIVAETTNERAQFIVEENGLGYYVFIDSASETAVVTDVRPGKRSYLNTTSAGKAILANLPRERVEEIVDVHGLPARTEHTITDPATLYEELERVRERGYAHNKSERVERQWAIGVPIIGEGGTVIGGLSVSGPEYRVKGQRFDEEFPSLLLGIANELELNLAYS